MARTKIDYGIDLGTTNSAIARMENGEPVIKKTDTQKDTMPSCVHFNKKRSIVAGDSAANQFRSDKLRALKTMKEDSNTFIEFKRTMGTDKTYHSTNMNQDYSSEALSAEVIKKLKSFVTDEDINAIVITVPAKFTINQKDATQRAAQMAGFEHCELLQEPIAASMAYGLDAQDKNGLWLVFDFGGGTFDVALLKVEDGIMKVVDTEGDNHLGGKNIDYAIVDELLIPYLTEHYAMDSFLEAEKRAYLRDALKNFAEDVKINLSFNKEHDVISNLGDFPEDDEGEEIELDLKVTEDKFAPIVEPIFQKSVDICKDLLKRNNISGDKLSALILVGGPTFSPILRKMLKTQISSKVDTTCDPMTVVAKGAALYASTVSVSEELVEKSRDKTKIQLDLGYEATSVENEEFVTIKILKDKTKGNIPAKCFAEIVRSDKAWSSGKVAINESGEVVEVKLNEGKANAFEVLIYDGVGNLQPSEPSSFTIIQGSKIGSATLPYHIGVEVKNKKSGKVVFRPVKGLEKNQSLPATGTTNGLKTQKQIKPGVKTDMIKIPLYQGEDGSEGSRAIYNEHVYDIIITGEDLPSLLPEKSDVDLTIVVDKSERITLSAFFPYLNHTHEIEVPSGFTQEEIDAPWLETEIEKAKQTVHIIAQEGGGVNENELTQLTHELSELGTDLSQGRNDYDRKKQVLDNLRKKLRKIDDIQEAAEWPKTEEELKEVFYKLEEIFEKLQGKNEQLDESKIKEMIAQFKEQIPPIIKEKNVRIARELIDLIKGLTFQLIDASMGVQMEIMLLKELKNDFDIHEWSDRNKAQMLLNQGLQIAATAPSKQKLRPLIIELFKLLPNMEKPIFDGDDSVLSD